MLWKVQRFVEHFLRHFCIIFDHFSADPWLKSHQEIEVVSRDRAGAYADAVKRALPHATQVADRYHLVQNLREQLQQFLDRKRTCLPEVEDILLTEGSTNNQGLRDSLADQTSTVESHAEAAGSQTEKTSQPEAHVEAEAPRQPGSRSQSLLDLRRTQEEDQFLKPGQQYRMLRVAHPVRRGEAERSNGRHNA